MQLSRVSLRNRNPENEPNEWQAAVLQEFEARLASGESADALAEWYAAHPDATLIAGATDVGLWVTKTWTTVSDRVEPSAALMPGRTVSE